MPLVELETSSVAPLITRLCFRGEPVDRPSKVKLRGVVAVGEKTPPEDPDRRGEVTLSVAIVMYTSF